MVKTADVKSAVLCALLKTASKRKSIIPNGMLLGLSFAK